MNHWTWGKWSGNIKIKANTSLKKKYGKSLRTWYLHWKISTKIKKVSSCTGIFNQKVFLSITTQLSWGTSNLLRSLTLKNSLQQLFYLILTTWVLNNFNKEFSHQKLTYGHWVVWCMKCVLWLIHSKEIAFSKLVTKSDKLSLKLYLQFTRNN